MPTQILVSSESLSAEAERQAPERPAASRLSPATWVALVLPLLLLLAWQAITSRGTVPPALLPSPGLVLRTLIALARSGELTAHLAATGNRMIFGFLLGAAVGTLFGALTGAVPLARRLLDPLVQALRSVPSIAWVPLFIIWFGIFEASKVALIAVGVFFPVYLNLMTGIANVDRKLIEVGQVHRLGRLALVVRVLVPASLPAYLTGLRSGLGLGWMFVAAAELMGASDGLGFLLTDGEQTGRPETVIAAILLFALCGKATDLALAALGGRLVGWQDTARP